MSENLNGFENYFGHYLVLVFSDFSFEIFHFIADSSLFFGRFNVHFLKLHLQFASFLGHGSSLIIHGFYLFFQLIKQTFDFCDVVFHGLNFIFLPFVMSQHYFDVLGLERHLHLLVVKELF